MTGSNPALSPTEKQQHSGMPFVGRQTDLEILLNLFDDPSIRLVTILGTGGVGKTRIALELARSLHTRFRHGAVFVSLVQLNTIEELLPAVAGNLGVQLPPGGDLQQAVLDHLGNKQVLLVLDNFEHLLEEAILIHDILDAAPQVKVLVTSREKLNLECETLYHLRGLELPPPDYPQNVEEFDAVRLFLQKARRTRPGFSLNAENTPAVVRICRLVDGSPLGILLAAAWVEHFSLDEIAEQISRNLDFLASELRDAPLRHSGMRAVFDSSFDRLDKREKSVFRKLAVFRGGFNLVAAGEVASADLRILLALVDKSLLLRDPDSGRYDMHELLRQYAYEELAAAGERENILAAHAGYYIAFTQQREPRLISSSQVTALDEIQGDFENIRQALSWRIEKRDFKAVRSVIPAIYTYCDMRSRFYEGEAIFRLASQGLAPQNGEAPHPAWALALLSWYDMRMYIEQFDSYEEITSQAQGCLEQAKAMQDAEGTAASLVLLGAIAEDQGDFKTAIQYYEGGMQFHPLLDDVYWINLRIGLCHEAVQQYPQAIAVFQTSLQRGKTIGERIKLGWSLLNIGDALLQQGNPAEAEPYLTQAIDLFQMVGNTLGILCANYRLSRIALDLGNRTRSRQLAETARQIARQLHSTSWIRKVNDLLEKIEPESHKTSSGSRSPEGETFSQREMEVLRLLKSDMSGPEMAQTLVVSINTIRFHTKNIYQKLQVNNRLEAIHRANELGL